MERLVQTLVDAVSVGSLYALTALGIGLIFGVMRLINFAHGELITFAAYTLLALFGLPVPVILFGAIVVAVALALITERAAFRPLRNADPTTLLISSFAVSFFLQKLLILVVGSRLKGLDFLPALGHQIELLGIRLQLLQVATILVSAILLIALTWFLQTTRLGLQMRAAAEDFRMARVLGVRANRVIAMAFALSARPRRRGVVPGRRADRRGAAAHGVATRRHRLCRYRDRRPRQPHRCGARRFSGRRRLQSCCRRCCRPSCDRSVRPLCLSPWRSFFCSARKG